MTGSTATAGRRLYVAYYRVSTGKQAFSGLGLDAQCAAVREFVGAKNGRLIAEYSETASGRKGNRPQLRAALSLCRITRATLAVARLDRLYRNVELMTGLMESGLDFVAIDFPEANRFTIHILAAVAEYEAGIQSERMKAILAAQKPRVRRPPGAALRRFPPGCQRTSALVRQERADARAADLAPLVQKAIAEGKSYAVIAAEFNDQGVRPHRRAPWSGNAIWRLVQRANQGWRPATSQKERPPVGAAQVRVAKLLREVGPLLVARRQRGRPVSRHRQRAEPTWDTVAARSSLGPDFDPSVSRTSAGRPSASRSEVSAAMTLRPVVVYYRVSSKQQKSSGLGLLAQEDAVRRYLAANPTERDRRADGGRERPEQGSTGHQGGAVALPGL